MADAGLFIGWGALARGREKEAVDLFNEILGYYGRLQEDGDIESFEPVFLEAHGGDLAGFVLVRGDAEKLASIRVSEEFTQYTIRCPGRAVTAGIDLSSQLIIPHHELI